jgi:hypothetical protein
MYCEMRNMAFLGSGFAVFNGSRSGKALIRVNLLKNGALGGQPNPCGILLE